MSEAVARVDPSILQRASELYRRGDYVEAMGLYERMATLGDASAQVFLGWMYHQGLGAAKDEARANEWFLRAAESGHAEGMFYAARLLSARGEHGRAFAWYQKASDNGFMPADYRLGISYLKGAGVPLDIDRARYYLRRASDAGHIFALRQLGLLMIRAGDTRTKLSGALMVVRAIWRGIALGLRDVHSSQLKW